MKCSIDTMILFKIRTHSCFIFSLEWFSPPSHRSHKDICTSPSLTLSPPLTSGLGSANLLQVASFQSPVHRWIQTYNSDSEAPPTPTPEFGLGEDDSPPPAHLRAHDVDHDYDSENDQEVPQGEEWEEKRSHVCLHDIVQITQHAKHYCKGVIMKFSRI